MRREKGTQIGTRCPKYDSEAFTGMCVPPANGTEGEKGGNGDVARAYRWINVQPSPSIASVIARYCAVRPRVRCTATAETKRESAAWTNFLPAAHEQGYGGKCHSFISTLGGAGREIFALYEYVSAGRSRSAITATRRGSGERARGGSPSHSERPCKS